MKKFKILLFLLILTLSASVFSGCSQADGSVKVIVTVAAPSNASVISSVGEFNKSGNTFTLQLDKPQAVTVNVFDQAENSQYETLTFKVNRGDFVSGEYVKNITLKPKVETVTINLNIICSETPEILGIEGAEWKKENNSTIYRTKVATSKVPSALTVKAQGYEDYVIDTTDIGSGFVSDSVKLVRSGNSLLSFDFPSNYQIYNYTLTNLITNKTYNGSLSGTKFMAEVDKNGTYVFQYSGYGLNNSFEGYEKVKATVAYPNTVKVVGTQKSSLELVKYRVDENFFHRYASSVHYIYEGKRYLADSNYEYTQTSSYPVILAPANAQLSYINWDYINIGDEYLSGYFEKRTEMLSSGAVISDYMFSFFEDGKFISEPTKEYEIKIKFVDSVTGELATGVEYDYGWQGDYQLTNGYMTVKQEINLAKLRLGDKSLGLDINSFNDLYKAETNFDTERVAEVKVTPYKINSLYVKFKDQAEPILLDSNEQKSNHYYISGANNKMIFLNVSTVIDERRINQNFTLWIDEIDETGKYNFNLHFTEMPGYNIRMFLDRNFNSYVNVSYKAVVKSVASDYEIVGISFERDYYEGYPFLNMYIKGKKGVQLELTLTLMSYDENIQVTYVTTVTVGDEQSINLTNGTEVGLGYDRW